MDDNKQNTYFPGLKIKYSYKVIVKHSYNVTTLTAL